MAKYCCDCDKMKSGKSKKEGVYFCSEKKDFTNASKESCDKYVNGYVNRKKRNELYEFGEKAAIPKDTISLSGYVAILVF